MRQWLRKSSGSLRATSKCKPLELVPASLLLFLTKRLLQNPAGAVRLSAALQNNQVEVSRQMVGLRLYAIINAEEKESADRNMP
jgi:hypothetical protein